MWANYLKVLLDGPRHKPLVSYDNFDEYHTCQYVGFTRSTNF